MLKKMLTWSIAIAIFVMMSVVVGIYAVRLRHLKCMKECLEESGGKVI